MVYDRKIIHSQTFSFPQHFVIGQNALCSATTQSPTKFITRLDIKQCAGEENLSAQNMSGC